jgi:hypothetical protein
MMQNGFRRIALAQGLLSERLPPREVLASVEPHAAPRLDTTEAADRPGGGCCDGDLEMPVAGAALGP